MAKAKLHSSVFFFFQDIRSVVSSPSYSSSSSFHNTSFLFLFSDSGFASFPSSFTSYSSPAFSLHISSSSAPTFSSLAPSASSAPLFLLSSLGSTFCFPSFLFFLGYLFPSSAVSSFCLLFHCSSLFACSSSFVFLLLLLFLWLGLVLLFGFRLSSPFLGLLCLPLLWFWLPLSGRIRSPLSSAPSLLFLGAPLGSPLSLLCFPLPFLLLLRLLGILQSYRLWCSVSPWNIRRGVVELWPPGVQIFTLILLLTVFTSSLFSY